MSRLLALAFLAPVAGLILGAAPAADPNAYLEEVEGVRALDQVRAWNKATADILTKEPGFDAYQQRARALLEDEQHIAEPDRVIGDRVLNLWRDAKNPRGLWRVASLDSFAAGKPEWRTLIDVDALGKAEGKSWVWHNPACLPPAYTRCIVSLADGGTDASVYREFDMDAGKFVDGGFSLPAAKSSVAWAGPDALYVVSDYGPDTKTTAGYGRIVKLWRRGAPLAAATTVYEGKPTDAEVSVSTRGDGDRLVSMVTREIDGYRQDRFHVTPDGRLRPAPLPQDATVLDVLDGRVIAKVNVDWKGLKAGDIVAYAVAPVLAGTVPPLELVYHPSASQSVEEVDAGSAVVWVKLLDDVSGRLLSVTRGPDGRWSSTPVALPGNSTVHLLAAAGTRDVAFAEAEGMLTPPTLYAVVPGQASARIQALPARFDASKMEVTQRFATSKDGTRIPYFLVRKKGATKPAPALVHAYGGFRVAQTPTYLTEQPYRGGPSALFWVEEGNAYVLANIRGGGEYGPAWHRAVLRENRQKAYDDFHAVSEDLIRTGVTTAGRIAPSGRSNGGLLVGVLMEQRPDLYGAVIMGSPLADMQRYSHLLAGASWMGEYGDPDVPADWAFISKYSPYQNLKAGVRYPAPFIYTSTKDDRVHPGHARKFAARLGELGDRFYYAEAIEGGHAAGADRREDARRAAMIITYLNRELVK